jgi:hypothetical protein
VLDSMCSKETEQTTIAVGAANEDEIERFIRCWGEERLQFRGPEYSPLSRTTSSAVASLETANSKARLMEATGLLRVPGFLSDPPTESI